MSKVLIWFLVIFAVAVTYSLMKTKAKSDKLYEELLEKYFFSHSDDIPTSDAEEHLK
ncbi:hypothetical protein H8S17_06445 [Roseburia sp. BX1005]|uniref:Uncharacterized protein n=1 Tax=Roseburia zhanii TaxID=2763064 RepID=A0A923LPR5_9FIRM|nr:hypothetical protein [Roseburia zhanii]MBC5713854.1 hypothetical protein [Roseburia zhanii]